MTDKAESQRIANRLEEEARLVREGLLDPAHGARRVAALRSVAQHCEDYRLDLLARGDTAAHAGRTANAIRRLVEDAGARGVADFSSASVRLALGRLKASGRSARTCNFYLAAVKAFAAWLRADDRIGEVPRGLAGLTPYNEKEDRRLVRRALTKAELDRLLGATEAADPIEATRGPRSEGRVEAHVRYLSGPERAALYRLAMATGFRAKELRTLTPERFRLDGESPSVTVLACYAKNGAEAVQPITRELAGGLARFVEGRPPGVPLLAVPVRTAKMLRADLERAGIRHRDAQGRVVDFHSLRHSYITHLVAAGVNPKIVQTLARHSTITLTLDRYTHVEDADVRKALEGE